MNAKNKHTLDIPVTTWGRIKAYVATENSDVTYEQAAVALMCYGLEEYEKTTTPPPLKELVWRFGVANQGLPVD